MVTKLSEKKLFQSRSRSRTPDGGVPGVSKQFWDPTYAHPVWPGAIKFGSVYRTRILNPCSGGHICAP